MKVTAMTIGLSFALATTALADDLLIKVAQPVYTKQAAIYFESQGLKSEAVTDQWIRVQGNLKQADAMKFLESGSILRVQKNFKIKTMKNPNLQAALQTYLAAHPEESNTPFAAPDARDNPAIPAAPSQGTGVDPLLTKQLGMNDMGLQNALKINPGSNNIIVAVIDTGVDYTHEDLAPNMWRNPKEIPDNNIDDDNNGFVDDIVGWDFLDNDNKPYDLAAKDLKELLNGGNPGHGTHCAGNVAARSDNGVGISGVAPHAQIMAMRFIGHEGTTDAAIKAIRYAVDNGAKVLSNSWGSEGEDSEDASENQALRDAIQYAADHDVLFVAAAGNSTINNDTSPKRGFPASYDHANIISVAAVDVANRLAGFSNYGATTVDIAAPGVKVFSTTVEGKYSDVVIPLLGANWDGTSMACPHVAGAAALYWSAHPEKTSAQVKAAIMASAVAIPSMTGKVVTNGKLNVEKLMQQP